MPRNKATVGSVPQIATGYKPGTVSTSSRVNKARFRGGNLPVPQSSKEDLRNPATSANKVPRESVVLTSSGNMRNRAF